MKTKLRTLGLLIQEHRERNSLGQRDVAESIGFRSPSLVCGWELDHKFPNERHWESLATLLGISYEEIEAFHETFVKAFVTTTDGQVVNDSLMLGENELQYLISVVKVVGGPIPITHAAYYLQRRHESTRSSPPS